MAKKGKFKGRPGGEKGPAHKAKEKKHNPFEIHINRVKHDVVGRKNKLDRGLPGVSRAKAVKKVSTCICIPCYHISCFPFRHLRK